MRTVGIIFLAVTAVFFLSSCASRPQAAAEVAPAIPQPPPNKAAKSTEVGEPNRSTRKQAPMPSPTPIPGSEQTFKPYPKPSPKPTVPDQATSVAQLVNSGRLESSSKTSLVFTANKPVQQESPGLYEDAITLSRVRAALKASSLAGFADDAKVSSGNVTLSALENIQSATLAAAVDSALAASGVQKVTVNYVPVPDGTGN